MSLLHVETFLLGCVGCSVDVGDHLFRFEHVRVFILTHTTLPARMAFHRTTAGHDVPTLLCGMGDEAIHMVCDKYSFKKESILDLQSWSQFVAKII